MHDMLIMKVDINKIVIKKTQLRNVLQVDSTQSDRLALAVPGTDKLSRVSLIFHVHF